MLGRLVAGTEWSHFTDYLSPSFFDVVPARELRRVLGTLSGNYMRPRRLRDVMEARDEHLHGGGVPVSLRPDRKPPAPTGGVGDAILELYFHQIYAGETTILDLRSSAFRTTEDGLRWRPASIYLTWDPEFLDALRRLYRGYYGGDDREFSEALAQLRLEPARDIFLSHFGSGDQRAVAFDMATFHDTFHEAFVACREGGERLHGDFIGLGLYLATLYEHLESVGGAWDVRAAWSRAVA